MSRLGALSASAMRAASKVSQYWYINSSSGNNLANSHISLDSAGNIYTSYSNGLFKYNSDGVIQYQGRFPNFNSGNYQFFVFDSSGYGYTLDTNGRFIYKFNASTGAFVWGRNILRSGAGPNVYYKLCIDSSNNLYVLTSNGTNSFIVVSIDTSGTLIWSKSYTTSVSSNGNYGLEYGNGSLYVTGIYNSRAWICKIDTSGAVVWSYYFTSVVSFIRYLTIKGSNLALSYSVGVTDGGIVKMTDGGSSPSIDWQFSYGALGYGDLVFDSSINLYAGSGLKISKYNSSGTQLWCNSFPSSTGNSTDPNYLIDSSDRLLIGSIGILTPNNRFGFARVPNDGSKTGTYSAGGSTFIWAASTQSTSSSSHTIAATATVTVATVTTITLPSVTDTFTASTNTIVRTNIN